VNQWFGSAIRAAALCRILSLVIAVLVLSRPVDGQSSISQGQQATITGSMFEIGEILGAEYNDTSNELLLYASEARQDNRTILNADDVVKIGLAVLTVGNFAFSLERTVHQMEIWYLPLSARERLTTLFHRSTVEETFYRTDRVLKDLANGRRPDDSQRLGASALLLCSKQLCDASQVTVNDFTSTYVAFFELDVSYVFDGLRLWFDKPRLVVKAASRTEGEGPPDCIKEFAIGLTKNIDQLMSHPTLGKEFRRLRNLLLLSKVFGWASSLYVPISVPVLQSQQTATVKESRPFKFTDNHIVCRDLQDPRRVRDIVLRGGINSRPAPKTLAPSDVNLIANHSEQSTTGRTRHAESARVVQLHRPELAIRPAIVNSRRMLEVSIDQIVGLKREARR
jgi:hypothetical protein